MRFHPKCESSLNYGAQLNFVKRRYGDGSLPYGKFVQASLGPLFDQPFSRSEGRMPRLTSDRMVD